jgi:phosphopantetheine--protein transferase-like protein
LLGNDIVDIHFCEPPMHRNVRYLDRVCSPKEADAVRRSGDSVRALASIWAAKEAAFKFFSKQLTLQHFVPNQFEVQFENTSGTGTEQKVSILYDGLKTEAAIFSAENWVHAITTSPAMEIDWQVREIDKCFFGSRKASNESEAVRYLTRSLLDKLGLQDVSLRFNGRIPKLESENTDDFPKFVSLSHHGKYAAVALGWPAHLASPPSTSCRNFVESRPPEAVCFTCTA